MNSRPNYLDYAKAITIYLVVLGHYVYYLELPFKANMMWCIEHCITLFHMPLFFMVSGILYKERSFKDELKKGKEQLIIPCLLMCIISLFIGICFVADFSSLDWKFFVKQILGFLSGGDLYGYGLISYAGPLWFCFSLLTIKLIMSTIFNKEFKQPLICLTILLMGGVFY